jgi:hypothetical protein
VVTSFIARPAQVCIRGLDVLDPEQDHSCI